MLLAAARAIQTQFASLASRAQASLSSPPDHALRAVQPTVWCVAAEITTMEMPVPVRASHARLAATRTATKLTPSAPPKPRASVTKTTTVTARHAPPALYAAKASTCGPAAAVKSTLCARLAHNACKASTSRSPAIRFRGRPGNALTRSLRMRMVTSWRRASSHRRILPICSACMP